MKLLAISGSIRRNSYNLALLEAMKRLCSEGSTVSIYNHLEQIPVFNPDVDDNNIPKSVSKLLSSIRDSDGVIISTPEYAHGIPGALKNALDWVVSSDAIVLKPVVVTSVSTSGLGGVRSHAPLVLVLSAMNANVVVEGSINVPYAKKKFNSENRLTDEVTQRAIEVSLLAIKRSIDNA